MGRPQPSTPMRRVKAAPSPGHWNRCPKCDGSGEVSETCCDKHKDQCKECSPCFGRGWTPVLVTHRLT